MMKRRKRELWLVAMPSHGLRVLRAARMSHYFVSTSSVSGAPLSDQESRESVACPWYRGPLVYPHLADAHIQVELLKDLCRRIVYLSQSTRVASGHPPHQKFGNTLVRQQTLVPLMLIMSYVSEALGVTLLLLTLPLVVELAPLTLASRFPKRNCSGSARSASPPQIILGGVYLPSRTMITFAR
jgi:hypothetical protein